MLQCYGLLYKDAQNDPMLERFREGLIVKAAEALDKAHMVRYDHTTGYLHSTGEAIQSHLLLSAFVSLLRVRLI